MSLSTSLSPLSAKRFGSAEASHLLRRTGHWPTPSAVEQFVKLGPQASVDLLVDVQSQDPGPIETQLELDANVRRPSTKEEREFRRKAYREQDEEALKQIQEARNAANRADRQMIRELRSWWLGQMVGTSQPFEETMTLFWHGHFASRHRNVNDAYLMAQQNAFFRRHALDSFAQLCFGIVREPAMLKFLNNDRNHRRRPNENLARELMELFTLGEGNYSEHDIRQGARALTGYFIDDNDFAFRKNAHDTGSKSLLGYTGDFDADDFAHMLLEKFTCAQFISYKLYRHLVADIPDEPKLVSLQDREVINQLAQRLYRDRYELQPMLKMLLRSNHFYAPTVMGRKIKSPTELAIGTLRMLNNPKRNQQRIWQAMGLAGQMLFDPPTVAGWDGGRAWINTSTLFIRQNLAAYLVTGKRRNGKQDGPMDLAFVRQQLDDGDAQDKTQKLIDWFVGHHLPEDRREPLLQFTRKTGSLDDDKPLADLLLLITAMPEYQLM